MDSSKPSDDMLSRWEMQDTDTRHSLPLDFFNPPLLGRVGFEKTIINKSPKIINDDVLTFNTQSSSQWDSFRHFAYQPQAQFYNGYGWPATALNLMSKG